MIFSELKEAFFSIYFLEEKSENIDLLRRFWDSVDFISSEYPDSPEGWAEFAMDSSYFTEQ